MAAVLIFPTPPHVELNGGVVTKCDDPSQVGKVRFFIDYHDRDGCISIWDGPSYRAACKVLDEYRGDGFRVVDRVRAVPR